MFFKRTDLAFEANEHYMKKNAPEGKIDGVISYDDKRDNIYINRIEITNKNGEAAIGKPMGHYITIHAENIRYDNDVFESTCYAIADEIRSLIDFSDDDRALIIGLGNREITPDALGHEAVSHIMVTNHIKELKPELLGDNFRKVCALAPGVLGTTGIESAEVIKSLCHNLKPKVVIAVDALAAASLDRVLKTFQICDTGIQPGAGVGNNRAEISESQLGAKVIAVGVPTVIDASSLSDSENTGAMMVTPRDIDAQIKKAGLAIATGINLALHKNVSIDEINEYVG